MSAFGHPSENAEAPADRASERSPALGVAMLAVPTGPLIVPAAASEEESNVRLSLVLPTYNEKDDLPKLLGELVVLLDSVLLGRYEVLVVDDDSPDLTWKCALKAAERFGQIRVMRRRGERGLSTAVVRGWQAARGDYLGVMDADLQHPPAVILRLFQELERGAELAVGSRHVIGGGVSSWSLARRILSRGAQFIGLLVLPGVVGRLSDPMSGYFLLRRSVIANVELNPIGYKILLEVLARGKARWLSEVGYVFREREDGASKVTLLTNVQYLRHLLRLRIATLPTSRLFRFCVVGGSGVLIDMSLLYVLSAPGMPRFGLTLSKVLAASCAMVSNFALNDAWTFKDLAQRDRGRHAKLRRFLGFSAICGAGIALNLVLLNALFILGVNQYAANLFGILAVTGWNYWLNVKLNWTPLSMDT